MSARLEKLEDQLKQYIRQEGLPELGVYQLLRGGVVDLTAEQQLALQDFEEQRDRALALEPPRIIDHFHEEHDDDGSGGSYTQYIVCEVPFQWSDEQIGEWVREEFPARHCQHEHDCCGQYYPGNAEWAKADVDAWRRPLREQDGDEQPPLKLLVCQGYSQNV